MTNVSVPEERDLTIHFRPACPKDVAYLKSTWLHSFRSGEGAKGCPNSVYYGYHDAILRHVIPRCSNANGILIAYEALDPDASWGDKVDAPILGYIACEPLTDALLVHMVYVRGHDRNKGPAVNTSSYRQRGIAKALLAEAQRTLFPEPMPVVFTHRTEACWKIYEFRKYLERIDAQYIPYLTYTLLPQGWETGAL